MCNVSMVAVPALSLARTFAVNCRPPSRAQAGMGINMPIATLCLYRAVLLSVARACVAACRTAASCELAPSCRTVSTSPATSALLPSRVSAGTDESAASRLCCACNQERHEQCSCQQTVDAQQDRVPRKHGHRCTRMQKHERVRHNGCCRRQMLPRRTCWQGTTP